MEYVASVSGGKDSIAMVLKIMELGRPLTKCVFFDTGWEFSSVYKNIYKIREKAEKYGCEFVTLTNKDSFNYLFAYKQVKRRTGAIAYGYSWCGKNCRWGTGRKLNAFNSFIRKQGDCIQYVGIAADETKRIKEKEGVIYPLVELGMSEKDCLAYCREKGFNWREGNIDLYDFLDRVSCFCCRNKNLKELENMYRYLPEYWQRLRTMQRLTDEPFRKDGFSIFDLERRFSGK